MARFLQVAMIAVDPDTIVFQDKVETTLSAEPHRAMFRRGFPVDARRRRPAPHLQNMAMAIYWPQNREVHHATGTVACLRDIATGRRIVFTAK